MGEIIMAVISVLWAEAEEIKEVKEVKKMDIDLIRLRAIKAYKAQTGFKTGEYRNLNSQKMNGSNEF
jgi:hypothetical protein